MNNQGSCGSGGCGCSGPVKGAVCAGPHACVQVADALLAQAASFVEQLDDVSYSRVCALASGGTIGKHVRHCVDHYAAAIGAIADSRAALIDYDHRDRDVPMETCRTTAMEMIEQLRSELASTVGVDVHAAVTVRVMVSDDGRTVDLASTIGRELAFAAHHALHHHAMMKFIADSFGCETPAGFGRAPSTINHERRSSDTLKV